MQRNSMEIISISIKINAVETKNDWKEDESHDCWLYTHINCIKTSLVWNGIENVMKIIDQILKRYRVWLYL